ncbi:mitogen-activated protein kinase kinase kinase 1-like [Rosa sericea]
MTPTFRLRCSPDCEKDDPKVLRMSPEAQLTAFLATKDLSPDSCWERISLLGRGSFGSVYEGCSENGFRFAVKQVSLREEGSHGRKCVAQLQQETALLSRFEHKNIVQYYGSYQDKSNLFMLMELVPQGSLRSFYQRSPLLGLRASEYTKDILHGLKYLHDQDVVHRDIKCANILVDAQGTAKLADFGLAKITKMNDIQSLQGTPYWTAPEVFTAKKNKQGYGLPADIWSLGCTVLEMLTRRVPYPDLEPQHAFFKILMGQRPEIPDSLPVHAQDFIKKCLQMNPNDRPTAGELLDHPFVLRRIKLGNVPGRGSVLKTIFSDLTRVPPRLSQIFVESIVTIMVRVNGFIGYESG